MIVFVASIGFVLAGFDRVVAAQIMFPIWLIVGFIVASATHRIENYISRRRG